MYFKNMVEIMGQNDLEIYIAEIMHQKKRTDSYIDPQMLLLVVVFLFVGVGVHISDGVSEC